MRGFSDAVSTDTWSLSNPYMVLRDDLSVQLLNSSPRGVRPLFVLFRLSSLP